MRTLTSLTRPAQLVCDSPYSLQDVTDYLNNILLKTTTTRTLLSTHSRWFKHSDQSQLWPCYDSDYCTSKADSILVLYRKPITSLRRLLTNVKDREKPEDTLGEAYRIKCCDCQATHIGETGRNLSTRLTQHKRAHCWTRFTNESSNRHIQFVFLQMPPHYFIPSCGVAKWHKLSAEGSTQTWKLENNSI